MDRLRSEQTATAVTVMPRHASIHHRHLLGAPASNIPGVCFVETRASGGAVQWGVGRENL